MSFSSFSLISSRESNKPSIARTFKNPLLAEAAQLAKAQAAVTRVACPTSTSGPSAAQAAAARISQDARDAPKRSRWLDEDEEAGEPEPEVALGVNKQEHSPIVWDDTRTARADRPRSAGGGLSAAERALAEVEEFRRRQAEVNAETEAVQTDQEIARSDGRSMEPFMAASPDISSPEEEMHIRREANSYHELAGLASAPASVSPHGSLERPRGTASPAPGPRPASQPGSNDGVEVEGYPEVEASEEEEGGQKAHEEASPRRLSLSSDREVGDHRASSPSLDTAVPAKRQLSMLNECRSVENYEKMNRISEGTYGVVYRARDRETGAICALKKVKLDKERDGFPLTSVREINVLLSLSHPSIVNVSEVVVGSSLDMVFMVMEYADHDLKSVMDRRMNQPFSTAEIKCLMRQLLDGVAYLHANWVIHRDLKTSNILYNNRGQLKICDFGLARQYGEPLKPYSQLVVTLWYRAPELLLGGRTYSTAVDVWSCGCIMGELLAKAPLFAGQNELGQLDLIFATLGHPTPATWPGLEELPLFKKFNFKGSGRGILRAKFPPPGPVFDGRSTLSEAGHDLLSGLLELCPVSLLHLKTLYMWSVVLFRVSFACADQHIWLYIVLPCVQERRISAAEALNHPWFHEHPLPKDLSMMPTFPGTNESLHGAK